MVYENGYDIQATHHFADATLIWAKPLLRSATSVTANHRDANHSRSAADRIAKYTSVLQELEESRL
ncbi:MAG: four helix bundle protein [Ardenticatenales bacterium]|nr:four helix bundle protein [Ardenticatenales bacterium]